MQHPHYIALLFSSMASMHAVSPRANRAGSVCTRTSRSSSNSSSSKRRRVRSRCTNSSHGYAVSSARVGGPANNTGLLFLTSESTIPKWWASGRFLQATTRPPSPPLCAFFWRNHANQCRRSHGSYDRGNRIEPRRNVVEPGWLTGLTRVDTPRGGSSGWQTYREDLF